MEIDRGTTATTFPTLITPRGFSFDGGDYINLGDNDAFTFADGVNDLPFSLAATFTSDNLLAGSFGATIVTKMGALGTGEWGLYSVSGGLLSFVVNDANNVGYASVYTAAGTIKKGQRYVIVATRGTGAPSINSMNIYINGVKQACSLAASLYTRMRNTAVNVLYGQGTTTSWLTGPLILPEIYDVELSECEVRALTARMQRQARSR